MRVRCYGPGLRATALPREWGVRAHVRVTLTPQASLKAIPGAVISGAAGLAGKMIPARFRGGAKTTEDTTPPQTKVKPPKAPKAPKSPKPHQDGSFQRLIGLGVAGIGLIGGLGSAGAAMMFMNPHLMVLVPTVIGPLCGMIFWGGYWLANRD